jgi:hypothetical protein
MPYYKGVLDGLIKDGYRKTARDIADKLLRLRTKLRKELPDRNDERHFRRVDEIDPCIRIRKRTLHSPAEASRKMPGSPPDG